MIACRYSKSEKKGTRTYESKNHDKTNRWSKQYIIIHFKLPNFHEYDRLTTKACFDK